MALILDKKIQKPKKISFIKIIFLVWAWGVGLFILFAVGCAIYFQTQFLVYQDDQYKFSIRYPKNWKIIVHPKENVAVIFLRPKDTALDVVQENFNVTVQPLPEGIFSLDEFSNRLKGQMIAVFGRGIVEYVPIHWTWHQGYRMTVKAPKPDNLVMVNAWTLNNDRSYIMTYLGNIDKYPQDSILVKTMIRSFHLQ